MAPEHSNTTDAFVVAIEAKIAAWKAVLDSYRAAAALDGPLSGVAAGGSHRPHHGEALKPMDLPVGVFRDKSLKEAIEIYLAAGRRKQTNKEIAIGLQRGGIATTATNFEATVATALGRMKDDGTVLRFPDGWDLSSSYPDSLRSRLEKDASPKKTRGHGKKRAATARTINTAAKAKPSVSEGAKSLDQRLMDFFIASGATGHGFLPKDAGLAVNEADPKAVGMAFARLIRYGKVVKDENGRYRAA